jgi:hypothetical protein
MTCKLFGCGDKLNTRRALQATLTIKRAVSTVLPCEGSFVLAMQEIGSDTRGRCWRSFGMIRGIRLRPPGRARPAVRGTAAGDAPSALSAYIHRRQFASCGLGLGVRKRPCRSRNLSNCVHGRKPVFLSLFRSVAIRHIGRAPTRLSQASLQRYT